MDFLNSIEIITGNLARVFLTPIDMWTAVIIAVISSSIPTSIFGYLRWRDSEKRKERATERSFDEVELQKYKDKTKVLEGNVKDLLISTVNSLVPEWKKDSNRRYVYVSPSYEISILFPLGLRANDIKGKNDAEIFGSYPDFVQVLRTIDDQAQRNPHRVCVRRGVNFPLMEDKQVVVKEIAQGGTGETYFMGRCYPDSLFD